MNNRLLPAFALFIFVVTAHAAPVPPATNKDGSVVSGFTRANFDPSAGVTPRPCNAPSAYPTPSYPTWPTCWPLTTKA